MPAHIMSHPMLVNLQVNKSVIIFRIKFFLQHSTHLKHTVIANCSFIVVANCLVIVIVTNGHSVCCCPLIMSQVNKALSFLE